MKIIIWLFVFLSLITGVSARISDSTDLFNLYLGNALIFDFFIMLFTLAVLVSFIFKTKAKGSLVIGGIIAVLLILWENTQKFILNDFGFMFWIVLIAFWVFSSYKLFKKKISRGMLFFVCVLYFLFYLLLYPNIKGDIPEYFQTVLFWAFIVNIVLLVYFIGRWFYKGGIAASKKIGPAFRKAFEEKKEKIEATKKEKTEEVKKEAEKKREEATKKIAKEVERAEERDDTEKIAELESKLQETIETVNEEEAAQLEAINEETEQNIEEVEEEETEEEQRLRELMEQFKENAQATLDLIEEQSDWRDIVEKRVQLADAYNSLLDTPYEEEAKELLEKVTEKMKEYSDELQRKEFLYEEFNGEVQNLLKLIERKEGSWQTIQERHDYLIEKLHRSFLNTPYEKKAKALMEQATKEMEDLFGEIEKLKRKYDKLSREYNDLRKEVLEAHSEMILAKKQNREDYGTYKEEWEDKREDLAEKRKGLELLIEELKKYGVEV